MTRPQHMASRRARFSPRAHDVETRPNGPSTEPFELRSYRVLVMANLYDKDEGRFELDIRASGYRDAENQALEEARSHGHRTACVLRTQLIEQPGEALATEDAGTMGTPRSPGQPPAPVDASEAGA